MDIKTLIIGYKPLVGGEAYKPSQIRSDTYFRDLLKKFDLGEVHFVDRKDYKPSLDALNPFICIVFDDSVAEEVKDYKKDMFLYVTHHPDSIFWRKKDVESRQKEQEKTFNEIEGLIIKIEEGSEEKQAITREVAGMGYKEQYEIVKQAIISDRPELAKRAWEVLNDNNVHPNFLWMRANIIVDCWQASDAKGKEEFLTIAMEEHVKNGAARRLEDFTGEEGIQYKQYMFVHPDGSDLNYIRRIPIATAGMNTWAYENLLEKYETPNGARMLLEVGQAKDIYKKQPEK